MYFFVILNLLMSIGIQAAELKQAFPERNGIQYHENETMIAYTNTIESALYNKLDKCYHAFTVYPNLSTPRPLRNPQMIFNALKTLYGKPAATK